VLNVTGKFEMLIHLALHLFRGQQSIDERCVDSDRVQRLLDVYNNIVAETCPGVTITFARMSEVIRVDKDH